MKLSKEFYLSEDVVGIAKELLGKVLCTRFSEGLSCGIISETEAYAGITDRASHAYGDRHTSRTRIMYRQGGLAYIYLCYGVHSLFNVVTAGEGTPHAVLIRGVFPVDGQALMLSRTSKNNAGHCLTDGPGKLSKALGLHFKDTGTDLSGGKIWIEERGIVIPESEIYTGPRIGIDYAGEDAKLPYRFLWVKKR